MARVIHIRPSNDGLTLASALRKILGPSVPWSEIKRLVAKRYITVNGNLCVDEGRRVKSGDVLHLHDQPRPPLPDEDDIRIVHLDEHLIVIDKPAGLTTLRHHEETDLPQKRKDKAPTLDELLTRKLTAMFHAAHARAVARRSPRPPSRRPARPDTLPATPQRPAPPPHPLRGPPSAPPRSDAHATPTALNAGPTDPMAVLRRMPVPPRLRPVHRLDRDTSGLMLFALSPAAEAALERDFARHAVDRRYLAIVHGQLTQPRTLETWIVRDRGDGLRGSSPLGAAAEAHGGQRAVTHITPVDTAGDYTVVECRLETGRTHQIRIHLSELGHPLAGEKLYTTRPPSPHDPPRHALHSHRLAFTHPITGLRLAFESPLPRDLSAFLRRARHPPHLSPTPSPPSSPPPPAALPPSASPTPFPEPPPPARGDSPP
ncbi:MAG: RluA family pseudouridine synthase [Tepidisphaerales bacterium]